MFRRDPRFPLRPPQGRRFCPPSFVSTSNRPYEFQNRGQFFFCSHNETRSIAMRVNNPYRSPVGIHGMSLIPSIIETRLPASLAPTLVALPSMSRVPRAPLPSLRNQKKLSCVWIFHDGPGRKIGDIDILSLLRQIRTRDHPFPARDRNSIGQTSFCFFYIRG